MMLAETLIGPTNINAAIERAARQYGVSADALRVIAQIESGGRADAKNPKSSAGGLFQFIDSTAKQYGLSDRFNPDQASDAAARLLRDNAASLRGVLGRDPTVGELYLAHQQGAGGARKLLANPNALAVDIVGADAVRLNGGRSDMTAGEFAQIWTGKAERIAGGGGNATIAGGAADDDLSDVYGFLGVQSPAPQNEPQQASPIDAYASTGALSPAAVDDLADVYSFLGARPSGAQPAPMDEAASIAQQARAAALGLAGPGDAPVVFPETFWQGFARGQGIGGRSVVEGLVGVPEILLGPATSIAEAITGRDYMSPLEATSAGLTMVGVPEPSSPSERIISATTSGAVGSLGFAGLAKGASGLLTGGGGEVARQLATGPGAQMAGGAGAGFAAQTAAEAGAGPAGQIAAGLGGAILGGGIAGARGPRLDATADEVAAAERIGIKPMTSDVMPPRTFIGRNAQRMGEAIPYAGTGRVRAAQETARQNAVRNLVAQFGAAPGVSDDVMRSLSAQRKSELIKYEELKGGVISSIKGTVPVTNATKAIDDQLARLKGMKTAEVQPVIRKLKDWKRALQGQDLATVEANRSQIGESFAAPDMASVRSIGQKALSSIYGELRKDMGDFIKANGDRRDFTKWSVANKRLSELIGDAEVSSMRSALKKGDATPEMIKGILLSKKPSDVRLLFRSLPKEGKAQARAAIVQDMFEQASTGEVVSPARFASQLAKRANQIGIFFEGADLAAVNGLKRALDLTSRAGEAAASPPSGVQNTAILGTAALTDVVGGFGAAVTSGAAMGLGVRAAESAAARNLLIALSKAKPGSPEEMKLAKRALETIRAANQTELQ